MARRPPKPPLGKGHMIGLMRQDIERVDVPEMVRDADKVGPTVERLNHAVSEEGEPLWSEIDWGDRRSTFKALKIDDTPLARLRARKKNPISALQFQAGEKYYALVGRAGLMPSGTANLDRTIVDGGNAEEMSDAIVAAKVKYDRIKKTMAFNLWDIVDALTVRGIGFAEYAERFREIISGGQKRIISDRRDRQIIAFDRLCLGLDWLADEFHLKAKRPGIVAEHSDTASIITREGEVEQRLSGRMASTATG